MTYWQIISAAAKYAKVSAVLLYAICSFESRDFELDFSLYDGNSPSYGVCQIKKSTAEMFAFSDDPIKLRDPRIGTKYAALYLKYQLERYNNDWHKAVAAYNSGSYTESSKNHGCAKNSRYVKSVQQKLKKNLQYRLDCGKDKRAVSYIDTIEE